jgi:diguanylate cyclase (GGDEF)-like protein/hemerythrin-like metal-binding protein
MIFPGPMAPSLLLAGLAALATLGWWRVRRQYGVLARRAEDLAEQVHHLQEEIAHLEEAASHDRLTGAWNRRHFEAAAASGMGLARRRRVPLSLIILDLDHFKRINDTYGHAAGDTVLAGAAAAFRPVLRTSDLLVRWGGEEFLVLAPATGLEGAVRLAERLRAALEAAVFPAAESVTLSAGVAEFLVNEPLDAWIARTDAALYRAKDEGRNRVIADHGRTPRDAEGNGLLELVWEDAYGSGHRLIDEQHVLLFDLSNALFSALIENQPPSVVESRLDTLLLHAERHFHDEETLLRRAGYPDLEQHRGEHARILAEARRLQAELRAGRVNFGGLVTYLATGLVKGHLLTEDRHYFAHLNANLGVDSRV